MIGFDYGLFAQPEAAANAESATAPEAAKPQILPAGAVSILPG